MKLDILLLEQVLLYMKIYIHAIGSKCGPCLFVMLCESTIQSTIQRFAYTIGSYKVLSQKCGHTDVINQLVLHRGTCTHELFHSQVMYVRVYPSWKGFLK